MVTGGGAYIANGLYNADCITAMRTMPNECVDMVLTDPPYNINFVPQRTAERGAILNDNLSVADFDKLLGDYFTECYRLLKPDTFLVSFMSWATIPAFEKAIRAASFQIKSMPIWVKNNFGIGYYTRPQYEPMYLAIKGNPAPPETAISDVLQYARVVKQVHTCEKPMPLLQRLIGTFSHEGDVIFDGFAGGVQPLLPPANCGVNIFVLNSIKTTSILRHCVSKTNLRKRRFYTISGSGKRRQQCKRLNE